MTSFKLQTSGIGSDRSTKWATTSAPSGIVFHYNFYWIEFKARLVIRYLPTHSTYITYLVKHKKIPTT